ncbi:uncharacterized protein DSM5745_01328 [Aspergillus mulundensis]|uniref:Uncharacterized protein n=1 Tax=Aspergillus mulundensis TaxID=1810919 RepID=A0A3D8T611_9EURO|nr:hypothetical protein DSM5745_01328 [Aspergillus mulundensis]RDW94006.1 hypothetical protein DSM5745_01328 [Aspergillus mulundensis]
MFRPSALVNLVGRVFSTAPRAPRPSPLNPIPVGPIRLIRQTPRIPPPSLVWIPVVACLIELTDSPPQSDSQLNKSPVKMPKPSTPVLDGTDFWPNESVKGPQRRNPARSVGFTQIRSARSGKNTQLKSILKPEGRIIVAPKIKLRPWVKRKGVRFDQEIEIITIDRWIDPLEHLHSANWDLETLHRHRKAQEIAQNAKLEKAEAEKARPLRSAMAKGKSTMRKCYDAFFKVKPTKRVQFDEYCTVTEFERHIDPEKDVHPESEFGKGKYLTAWKVKHNPEYDFEMIGGRRVISRKDSHYTTWWSTAPWGQMYRHMEPCRQGTMCSWNEIADLQNQNPDWYPADAVAVWLGIRKRLRIKYGPFWA